MNIRKKKKKVACPRVWTCDLQFQMPISIPPHHQIQHIISVVSKNIYTILVYLLLIDKKAHGHVITLFLSSCGIGLRCNTTLLYRKAKMLFGPYFHEKTGSLLCTPLHKVTKPPESLKIEAKYAKVCFLRQGLIPSLLHGSQVS